MTRVNHLGRIRICFQYWTDKGFVGMIAYGCPFYVSSEINGNHI